MQAVQYVVDVVPCHAGDLTRYDTQHQHTNGHQHRRVDVHSENSVRKKLHFFIKTTNINIHTNLCIGSFVTPHGKR
jgi:hypothetical protein